jgi:uncharacterized phage protein (TIGR02220 family)
MKDQGFINVQGWMINHTPFTGNDLLFYALVYGFSQDGRTKFKGGYSYIAKTLKITRRGAMKLCNRVVKTGYINSSLIDGFNHFWANLKMVEVVNKVHHGSEQSSPVGSEQSSPINNSSNYLIKDIVNLLNSKTGKLFKPTAEKNKKHIIARINEGYVFEDFQKVINTKTKDWLNDPKMDKFLRPETLFGPKFENYLNENPNLKAIKTPNQQTDHAPIFKPLKYAT